MVSIIVSSTYIVTGSFGHAGDICGLQLWGSLLFSYYYHHYCYYYYHYHYFLFLLLLLLLLSVSIIIIFWFYCCFLVFAHGYLIKLILIRCFINAKSEK